MNVYRFYINNVYFNVAEKSKIKVKPKKKSKRSDESASEDSDDGDAEGKELDYISDSSEKYLSL